MSNGDEGWPSFLDKPDPNREPDNPLRNPILFVVGVLVVLCVTAAVGLLAGQALFQGRFDTADFELSSAQSYVQELRAKTEAQESFSATMDLPPNQQRLSRRGRVEVTKNQDNRVFEVFFWEREGMQSWDAYVYLESRFSAEHLYSDVSRITTIAPGWYFLEGGG
jgi:hypothetical protein